MCLLVDYFNGILWYFKINADISILGKSVILELPFCVFTGYSVLTYANDSLTCWLWKAFSWLSMASTTRNAQKVYEILQIFAIYPRLSWKFSILKYVDDV